MITPEKGATEPEAALQGQPTDPVVPASAERADPKLLEFLVCPVARTTLIYDEARQELISRAAGLAYPIRHGVAMVTVAAARILDDDEAVAPRPR